MVRRPSPRAVGELDMVEKPEKPSALSLLKIGGVSWSLLTGSEKILFALRVCSRVALNGLDFIAVGLMCYLEQ